MKDTQLFSAICRALSTYRSLDPILDEAEITATASHYYELLEQWGFDKWVYPDNRKEDSYTIMHTLYSWNIICRKMIPIYKVGTFRGNSIFFYSSKDLDYSQA